MPTIAIFYSEGRLRTVHFDEYYRAVAWNPRNERATLVGNGGKMAEVIDQDNVRRFNTSTSVNLRGISANPKDGSILIVGNSGTILAMNENMNRIDAPTFENLRTVSWNSTGTMALIGGNAGTLLKYSKNSIQTIVHAKANIRRISWHSDNNRALVSSNCFAEEFLPSPNLYMYDADREELKPVSEGRADLIGVAWKPNGNSALVVGYDVVWHDGFIAQYDGTKLTPVPFENKQVYPVAVAWNSAGDLAAVCTAVAQPGIGKGSIRLWDGATVTTIYENDHYFFSAVSWSPRGTLLALASPANRVFNC
jgi:WD40 repeat protein